jgi:DNA-binding NtrC family response regulator
MDGLLRLLCLSAPQSVPPPLAATAPGDCRIQIVATASEALDRLQSCAHDCVLARLPLDGAAPEEFLGAVQRWDASMPVVFLDPEGSLDMAVRLARLGAFHYLHADEPTASVIETMRQAAEHRRLRRLSQRPDSTSREPWREFLVGDSPAMQTVFQTVRLIGPRKATVMISGETGTGKEVAARAIHAAGPRSQFPMIAVNCGALPEHLLEAELFGHVRGAFTGAQQNRVGRFELAHRGTIFLDEIGELPLDLQAKLLRVVQEREFQRLGSSETLRVDVRFIAAANVDLAERVRQGRFREDLYYRLNVVPLHMPPLRARPRDVALLVHHFLEKVCRHEDLPPRTATPEALAMLSRLTWPGNVRQLENAVAQAVALSGDRETLYPSDFPVLESAPLNPPGATPPPAPALQAVALPDDGFDFERVVGGIERAILEQALERTGGNKKQAAEMLRLKRTTLTAKLKSLEASAMRA